MNQKNFNLNEKKKSIDISTKMTQMSELSEKDFTAVIIKMLQWTMKNMLEINGKKKVSTKKQSLSEEIENTKKNKNFIYF